MVGSVREGGCRMGVLCLEALSRGLLLIPSLWFCSWIGMNASRVVLAC